MRILLGKKNIKQHELHKKRRNIHPTHKNIEKILVENISKC